MVVKMPADLIFLEPEQSEFLYIDADNKVHLLLPLVAGTEIGIDNTCKTTAELQTFFYGTWGPSAEQTLTEYKTLLEKDIHAIMMMSKTSNIAFKDILEEKQQRLKQIEKYLEMVKAVTEQYDEDQKIAVLKRSNIADLPPSLSELIKESTNAFGIRLAPYATDPYTRLHNPLFSLARNRSRFEEGGFKELKSGLGYHLRTEFAAVEKDKKLINKKSSKDGLIETVKAQMGPDFFNDDPVILEQNFQRLKQLIQDEVKKIDPLLSIDKSLQNADIDLAYLDSVIGGIDKDTTTEDVISTIISCALDDTIWPQETTSVFYEDVSKLDKNALADNISVKTQFLLGEINFFCKTNKLSDANFGSFFDKEANGKALAKLIKQGLAQGEEIEPIIYNFINTNQAELGLSTPLTTEQQHEITERFTQNYNLIKESPHFDEFFLVDATKKGNVFTHRGKITCHFLDFFARQTKGAYPLDEFNGYADALQQGSTNALHHKNETISKRLDKFKTDVIHLIASKPEDLLEYLLTRSPSGVPNYSMLTLQTQNYIAFHRNWPLIEKQITESEVIPEHQREDLLRLLSRESVNSENHTVLTWEKYSKKNLLDLELHQVSEGVNGTVKNYNSSRKLQFWKGSRNEARAAQIESLQTVASDIDSLLQNTTLSRTEILEKVLNSINTLNRIDKEISEENNWFRSSLQKEVRSFRLRLENLYGLDSFDPASQDHSVYIELTSQLNKIHDQATRELVMKLPSHCHTDHAIDLFNSLTPLEAKTVASYLRLTYREFNSPVNKETLLEKDIPALFREINMELLTRLKEDGSIDEQLFEEMSDIADTIRPEVFTKSNIQVWSTHIQILDQSKLSEILVDISDASLLMQRKVPVNSEQLAKFIALEQELTKIKHDNREEFAKLPEEVKGKLSDFEIKLHQTIKSTQHAQNTAERNPGEITNGMRAQMESLRDAPDDTAGYTRKL